MQLTMLSKSSTLVHSHAYIKVFNWTYFLNLAHMHTLIPTCPHIFTSIHLHSCTLSNVHYSFSQAYATRYCWNPKVELNQRYVQLLLRPIKNNYLCRSSSLVFTVYRARGPSHISGLTHIPCQHNMFATRVKHYGIDVWLMSLPKSAILLIPLKILHHAYVLRLTWCTLLLTQNKRTLQAHAPLLTPKCRKTMQINRTNNQRHQVDKHRVCNLIIDHSQTQGLERPDYLAEGFPSPTRLNTIHHYLKCIIYLYAHCSYDPTPRPQSAGEEGQGQGLWQGVRGSF